MYIVKEIDRVNHITNYVDDCDLDNELSISWTPSAESCKKYDTFEEAKEVADFIKSVNGNNPNLLIKVIRKDS